MSKGNVGFKFEKDWKNRQKGWRGKEENMLMVKKKDKM